MHDCAVRPRSTKCLLCIESPFQKVNQFVRVLDKEVGRNRAKSSRVLKRSYWHVNSRSSTCNISLPIENRGSSQWDLPARYSSSLTCFIQSTNFPSRLSCMAMCVIPVDG